MKRIYQTPGDGQCFRCCLATLLGVPLMDVPRMLRTKDGWMQRIRVWTRYEFGLDLIYVPQLHAKYTKAPVIVCGIATGKRGAWHAIIVQNGRILHDPFPGRRRRGLVTWRDYYLLVPLEPSAAACPDRL